MFLMGLHQCWDKIKLTCPQIAPHGFDYVASLNKEQCYTHTVTPASIFSFSLLNVAFKMITIEFVMNYY